MFAPSDELDGSREGVVEGTVDFTLPCLTPGGLVRATSRGLMECYAECYKGRDVEVLLV